MTDPEATSRAGSSSTTGTVTVRYWAGAKAAAGVESDEVAVGDGVTLRTLFEHVLDLHADRPRFADVVQVCSVLIGDRPVGGFDPDEVDLRPGDVVELLPPFAGG